MGYYIQIDEQESDSIASNRGYGDFIRYVEGLSVSHYETLHHLTTFGWEQRVQRLTEELDKAIKQSPPEDATVLTTTQGLLDMLRNQAQDAVMVSITN